MRVLSLLALGFCGLVGALGWEEGGVGATERAARSLVRRRRLRPLVPGGGEGGRRAAAVLRSARGTPGTGNCTERFLEQRIDHFGWELVSSRVSGASETYSQRYFVCDEFWSGPGGPVFLYTGNEANVELYVNETGLMWETAPEVGALLLFVEHRYFGKSLPFGTVEKSLATSASRSFLSAEQALADYAYATRTILGQLNSSSSPVVAFGGSYGGMLASWFRLKYPDVVRGAIAGSAPIWAYEGEEPPVDPDYFAAIETFDASEAGGAHKDCANNYRRSWQALFRLGDSAEGRAKISSALNLCGSSPLSSPQDVANLANWAADGISYLAMGSYPYPSSYMLNGDGVLPPYPLRVGCESLGPVPSDAKDEVLLEGFREAIGVWFNYTHSLPCFDWSAAPNNATQLDGELWNVMACTEEAMVMGTNGKEDMFWNAPWNAQAYVQGCLASYNVSTRLLWPQVHWGGKKVLTGPDASASNILFSQGQLDPWRGGGVAQNISEHRDVTAHIVQDAGHHMDLMFSNPKDTPSVKAVRNAEREAIKRWIK